MTAKKIEENDKTEPDLPPVGLNVWVQCEGFRCLAYRTKDGKWMTAIGHKEVKDVIRVLSLD
jgi:GH24 family phage-related lysozyme (muramidase)